MGLLRSFQICEHSMKERYRRRRCAHAGVTKVNDRSATMPNVSGGQLPVARAITEFGCCPTCKGALDWSSGCVCGDCGATYPVVSGIPVLISGANHLFSADELSGARLPT